MSLQADFEAAVDSVKKLNTKPEEHELLKLYGLYKHGSGADFSKATKPAPYDLFSAARYKYNAWKAVVDTSQEDAQMQYVEYVKGLIEKYGLQPEEPKGDESEKDKPKEDE